MTNWLFDASLYGLLPLSMGGVAVGGLIAALEANRRRNLQRLLDSNQNAESLRLEIARIERELESRRTQLAELDGREIEAKQRIAQASRLEDQIAELEVQRDSLRDVEVQTRALEAEAQQARIAREVAQSQVTELEQKRDAVASAIASFDARKHQLEADLAQLSQEAGLARSRLEEARQDALAAIAQRESVREQLSDAESRRGIAEAMLASAEQKLQVLERRQHELTELEEAINTAREEFEHISIESSRRQAELEAAAELVAKHTARSEAISEEIEHLRLERSRAQGEQKDSSGEVGSQAIFDRLADVWKPVFPTKRELLPAANEKERLDDVAAYLRKDGLLFPDRVLHAFHTALKVSNEATLLILAGISGTGKSLLPQRYAEAMGMNFQLVPVQPRWDGPQDLLGFYNFLQNKYVGTELIRALAQVDQYSHAWGLPEDSEYVSLKDQMLLVLLDEMNLARIEYYFSDLLVKLETRRTIRPERPEERLKASIELNAGSDSPRGSRPIHVFPGSNCLFVGTMNEDESTQSISDKVVDRANVMRFAKPARLEANRNSEKPSPPSGRLSHAVWQSWQKVELSIAEEERVSKVIDELNDALAKVERPFGHRVKKAIIEYVKMYPRIHANSIDRALADQIEMRILPKLRGIEMGSEAHDCLQSIEDQVRELDTELANAIDAARDHSSSRFHWLGVSRDPETT